MKKTSAGRSTAHWIPRAAIYFFLIAAIIDWKWGNYALLCVDSVFAAGCFALDYFTTGKSKRVVFWLTHLVCLLLFLGAVEKMKSILPASPYPLFFTAIKEGVLLVALVTCIFRSQKNEIHHAATTHELGQPAQVILTNASLLKKLINERNFDPALMQPMSDRMVEASQRIAQILAKLRKR